VAEAILDLVSLAAFRRALENRKARRNRLYAPSMFLRLFGTAFLLLAKRVWATRNPEDHPE
jgi:hypothetical protein